jgi:hypothetical protein
MILPRYTKDVKIIATIFQLDRFQARDRVEC